MNKNDIRRFSRVLKSLQVVLDREREMSPEAEDAYFLALSDMRIEDVERAGHLALRTCKFLPKPAELRELVEGTSEDAAMKAWTCLENAFQKAGYWTSVLFEDGALAAAIEYTFGTWVICSEQLHMLSEEMLRAKQKEFFVQYRRAVREGKTAAKYLRGYCEITNIETLGKWNRGQPITENGQTFLRQPVFIQGINSGRTVEADFDFYSSAILTPLRELQQKPGPALPPKSEAKQLTEGEPIDQDAGHQMVREAVADLTSLMRILQAHVPLTDEQWESRRQELKRQAEAI